MTVIFAYHIFKWISPDQNCSIISQISLKFIPIVKLTIRQDGFRTGNSNYLN